MRAALIPRNGPPEVLEIGEAPVPAVGDGQVLVRVHASSVNPVDCYVRHGGLRRFSRVPFPIIPGLDISGVVEKVGSNTPEFRTGDEIVALIPKERGACAELVACDLRWLAKKPARLSYVESAALPCVGLTALQGLRDKARLKPGQSVLILGASGGVGTMAVQIARTMETEVIGVCSTANVDLVKSLGAARVIDYLKQEVLLDEQRFDAIFDCVGGGRFWSFSKLLRPSGRYVGISCTRRDRMDSMLSRLMPGKTSLQFHVSATGKDLEQLLQWVEHGKLKVVVSHVYPLERIAEAHRQCETRRTVGKIAVVIQ